MIQKCSNIFVYLKKTIFSIFHFIKNNDFSMTPNDHPWDQKFVAVVDRRSLFRGHLCGESSKWDLKLVVVICRWSLFRSGLVVNMFAQTPKRLFCPIVFPNVRFQLSSFVTWLNGVPRDRGP